VLGKDPFLCRGLKNLLSELIMFETFYLKIVIGKNDWFHFNTGQEGLDKTVSFLLVSGKYCMKTIFANYLKY
jgi:hypothetical protein